MSLFRKMSDCIQNNDIEKMISIVKENPECINENLSFAGTYLHIAANKGNLEAVKKLLELGFDINAEGGISNATPIHDAAYEGHLEIVKYLVENNSKLDESEHDKNPLFIAIQNGHMDVVKYLVEEQHMNKDIEYDGRRASRFALEMGQREIAEYLGYEENEHEKKIRELIQNAYEKYTIDDYKQLLKQAVKNHYERIKEEYEDIYAYTLYTCDDATSIGPVCNRECDIEVEKDDEDYIYYRYGADEYEIWEHYDLFHEVSAVMDKAIELTEDDDDQYEETVQRLFNEALEVMNELKEEGLFGKIDDNKYLAIWVSDSCDEIMEKSVKMLNTKKVYGEYASQFVEEDDE